MTVKKGWGALMQSRAGPSHAFKGIGHTEISQTSTLARPQRLITP